MSKVIKNRVADSKLVTLDLQEFYPPGERILFDIKNWLFKEQILKEIDFRNFVKEHDWTYYQNKYVALTCSADAIIPSWAYLLISVSLSPYVKQIVVGDLELLEIVIFKDTIDKIPLDNYKNKSIIIKGCSNKSIPQTAYSHLISKLLPIANSIMYGEACSNVPLYKKKL